MSWLDRITKNLIIKPGDGKSYTPNWLNAVKQKDYNVAEFEFPEVEGTLVYRSKPKAARYNLELYFQGEDHLDIARAFEQSSDDPRPWKLTHPFYGLIIVQPLGLNFDNTKYNVSKVSCTVVETITEQFPKGSVDPVDKIKFDKASLDVKVADFFATKFPTPTIETVNQLTNNVKQSYNLTIPTISFDIDASEYFNKYNTALSGILNITGEVSLAMTVVSDFYNAPIAFAQSVKSRIDGLTNQFLALRTNITTLFNNSSPLLTPAYITTYEVNAGSIISSIATSSVTNMDYVSRADVIAIIEAILTAYNTFIKDLDSFQTANGGSTTSYIPNGQTMSDLNDLINFTVSSLFVVALNSKQERSLYLESDSNIILLAHRLYGLQPDDNTIDTLIKNNNIGLNELLVIKKDRRIIWYA